MIGSTMTYLLYMSSCTKWGSWRFMCLFVSIFSHGPCPFLLRPSRVSSSVSCETILSFVWEWATPRSTALKVVTFRNQTWQQEIPWNSPANGCFHGKSYIIYTWYRMSIATWIDGGWTSLSLSKNTYIHTSLHYILRRDPLGHLM